MYYNVLLDTKVLSVQVNIEHGAAKSRVILDTTLK